MGNNEDKRTLLDEYREEIDSINKELLALLSRRMQVAAKVVQYKIDNGLEILQPAREVQVLDKVEAQADSYMKPYAREMFRHIMADSRDFQKTLLPGKRCGLIGGRLSYSHSKRIHEMLGFYNYDLCEIKENEVASYIANERYSGLNVTNPYKQTVIPFMDELTPQAEKIGAVNTVFHKDGKTIGDNTDYDGFLYLAKFAGVSFEGKNVLVLGDGATSGTICTAVRDQNPASLHIASRKKTGDEYVTYETMYDLKDTQVIINATSVGTSPDFDKSLADLSKFENLEGVLDVVYNPFRTRLILDAEALGLKASGGLPMLIAQALYAAKRFAPESNINIDEAFKDIYFKLRFNITNIVLIGMPGSGKSTFAKVFSKALNKEERDIDTLIEQREGMHPSAIIKEKGEKYFRDLESEVSESLRREANVVIATGGGTILRPENMDALRQNSTVVFLKRPLEKLPTNGRPISQARGVEAIYEERLPLYEKYADYTIFMDSSQK